MTELKIFASAADIADYTFNLLKEAETAALSFGSTYNEIFTKWKKLRAGNAAHRLPDFFPADERRVDISDPDSNWGTVRRLFIDSCGTDADRQRWAGDAETFRRMLKVQFGQRPPVFDLIFLGLGSDGHTASLFPDSCPSEGSSAWNEPVIETNAPFNPPKRLTLGPGLIASAHRLVLTVTGQTKAGIFKTFMQELDMETASLPPSKIILRRKTLGLRTEILCDEGAGSELDSKIFLKYGVEK